MYNVQNMQTPNKKKLNLQVSKIWGIVGSLI